MTKKELLLSLLEKSSAYVQLDGRREGVELPDWLRGEPSVVLHLGYDMPVPIPDLAVDDTGVVATLSFRRVPHRCVVPWSAIYTIADDDGHRALFPEDIPPDLIAQSGGPAAVAPPQPQPQPRPARVPAPAPASAPRAGSATPPSTTSTPAGGKKPRPSHLKLVK